MSRSHFFSELYLHQPLWAASPVLPPSRAWNSLPKGCFSLAGPHSLLTSEDSLLLQPGLPQVTDTSPALTPTTHSLGHLTELSRVWRLPLFWVPQLLAQCLAPGELLGERKEGRGRGKERKEGRGSPQSATGGQYSGFLGAPAPAVGRSNHSSPPHPPLQDRQTKILPSDCGNAAYGRVSACAGL